MKIGKSVVKFSITASPSCKYKSIDEVPYWSLYSRPGDCVQEQIGHQWKNDRAVTLAELKRYLERYPGRRLLDAYPRKSTSRRITYETFVQDNAVHIYSKWTGAIYATFVIQDNSFYNTFLAPGSPSPLSYYRKLAAYRLWTDGLITYDAYIATLPCKANNKN